ncbi:MAG TPA: protein kinase, partial [Bryobacteraceae bacterium]
MTRERYQLINALADAALELPESERWHFLEGACKDDPELLVEVEQLLGAQANHFTFMEAPLLDQLAQDLARTPEATDLPGKQFQHYEILRWLGSGGLGEVWLARDISLGREVALKLLSRASASNPLQIRRFQREARAASSLNHPNIVTIYEIGTAEEREYIAQEVVRGETLRELLQRGRFTIAQILDIGRQVAAALAAANSAGIVHRDIKPENIMLRPDGLVKVLDFGLARFIEGTTASSRATTHPITHPGIILGTAKYMSPEQARGLSVDARSDIFSLGAVLYEMAAGSAPFEGNTASDVMAAILSEEPKPIAKRVDDIPGEFAALVHRCLQKDPQKRYDSAQALKSELDRIQHKASATRPTRIWWIAAATALLAIIAFIAARFVLRRNSAGEPSFASMRITRIPVQGEVADAAISQNGDYLAYFLRGPTGESLWIRQVASSLESQILPPERGSHTGLAFSDEGKYISWLRSGLHGRSLYRMPVEEQSAALHIRDNVNSALAFSPNGEWYAFFQMDPVRRRTALKVASIDGRVERAVDVRDAPKYFARYGLAWSPDGRYIACFVGSALGYTSHAFHLVKIRVTDGREIPVGSRDWLWTGTMSWPTPGTIFASATEQIDDNFQVWDIATEDGTVTPVTNDLSNHSRLSASSDARTILTLQTQSAFELWVLAAGSDAEHAVQITPGNLRSFDSLAWLPDSRIVFSALGGESRNMWIMNSDGTQARQLTSGGGNKREVAVTPDGKYILYHAGGAIWRMDSDGSNARQLTYGPNDVHPEPTADGRSVLYGEFPKWSPGFGGKPMLLR